MGSVRKPNVSDAIMKATVIALLLCLAGLQAWAGTAATATEGQAAAGSVTPAPAATATAATAAPIAAGSMTPANGNKPAAAGPGGRRWADLPYGAGYEARQRGYGWRGGRGHGRR